MLFNQLGLSAELLRGIDEKGYREATPVQQQSIPCRTSHPVLHRECAMANDVANALCNDDIAAPRWRRRVTCLPADRPAR